MQEPLKHGFEKSRSVGVASQQLLSTHQSWLGRIQYVVGNAYFSKTRGLSAQRGPSHPQADVGILCLENRDSNYEGSMSETVTHRMLGWLPTLVTLLLLAGLAGLFGWQRWQESQHVEVTALFKIRPEQLLANEEITHIDPETIRAFVEEQGVVMEWVRDNVSMRGRDTVNAIDRLSDIRESFLEENMMVRARSPKHFEIVINVPAGHEEEGQAIIDAIVGDYLDFREHEVHKVAEQKIKTGSREMEYCEKELERLYQQRMSVMAQREEMAQGAERGTDSEVELWILENEIELCQKRFRSLNEEVTRQKYLLLQPNAIIHLSQ